MPLDHQLDLRDFHRVPVAVGHLVLEIAQSMPVASSFGRVLMFEGFFQPMPVLGTCGALGPVGHDDVCVTVRLVTGSTVRVLDDLHEAVDMQVVAVIMAMDVLVFVPVRHSPMLPVDVRSGEAAADQEQAHHARRRGNQQRPRPGDRLIERTGLGHRRLQPIEK